MRNAYAGTCYRCGDRVEAGAGHFERKRRGKGIAYGPSIWRLQHADCAIIWRGKPDPTQAEAKAARLPKAKP